MQVRPAVLEALNMLYQRSDWGETSLLQALSPKQLKQIWHQRAQESHPDRATLLGQDPKFLERRFKLMTEAYQLLLSQSGRVRARSERSSEGRYEGVIPKRHLRFAEFLYYTGRISWQSLVQALHWQRSGRPLIGQVAVDWGYLNPTEVDKLLNLRRGLGAWREPFAAFAEHQGYISNYQRRALLGYQKRFKRPIGRFFMERGLFKEEEIRLFLRHLRRYNSDFRAL